MRTRLALAVLLCGAISFTLYAGAASDYTVQVSAVASASPQQIVLSWPLKAASTYSVYRKFRDETTWTSTLITGLAGTSTGYTDTTAAAGQPYDYLVGTFINGVQAYGCVYSGINVPLVESRGKVLFVVDNTYEADLATELTRMENDLRGDGWTPVRISVGRNDAVTAVKNLIVAQYNADTANVKAVYLFGHVPVPYSGLFAPPPDGHANHYGAWPADTFYGEMNGTWTDTGTRTNATFPANNNVPGDGKYDQRFLPSDMELMVGRVDLANMPAFALSEKELLRQYLNKDHNFRHRVYTAPRRGLLDDHFGTLTTPPFSHSGLTSFSALFGAANVHALDWVPTLGAGTEAYLWGYGCGPGSFESCSGVAATSDFVNNDMRVVFTMLFGSYFGDWNVNNNMLRAPLATTTYGLTCAWAGAPDWTFHHMGLGEPIGFSTKINQNNTGSTYYTNNFNGVSVRGVFMNLMGDPTLRMHVVAPPTGFSGNTSAVLTWTAPVGETVAGYNVYRSASPTGPFTKLNGALIAGTTYTDGTATPGTYTYMVKTVKLETGSGTYFNSSQGIFTTVTVNSPPTLTAVTTLTGGAEDTAFPISYAVLATAANEADVNGDAISFRVVAVSSGTLTKGGVAVTPNVTLLGAGETLVWTPAAGASGAALDAFTITAWDGLAASSPAVAVKVDVTATPNSLPQIGSATAAPNPALVGQSVAFTLTATDADGHTLTYTWNFGDGASLNAANVTHAYAAAGTYTVNYSVSDGVGAPVTGKLTVIVTAPPDNGGGNGGGGGALPPDGDADGDGVSNSAELADGTNPNDAASVNKLPFTVAKMQLGVKFGLADKDGCAVSGAIPNMPALFDPNGQTIVLNVGGVSQTFTLNAKGSGKNDKGSIQLKLKPSKRNKTTKRNEFLGGTITFKYKVRGGTWSDDWLDEGIRPDKETKGEAQTYTVEVQLNGRAYLVPVTGNYAGKAGKGGKFKK